MEPKYRRILLKLSGEALAGENKFGLDYGVITNICESVKKCLDAGVEIGIVVGGGNFWRGRSSGGMDRTRADHMGMLATTINALAIADVLESLDIDVRVQTAITMQQVAEPYIRLKAMSHLKKGRVVIFGCGTGNPFFQLILPPLLELWKLRRIYSLRLRWLTEFMTRIRTNTATRSNTIRLISAMC